MAFPIAPRLNRGISDTYQEAGRAPLRTASCHCFLKILELKTAVSSSTGPISLRTSSFDNGFAGGVHECIKRHVVRRFRVRQAHEAAAVASGRGAENRSPWGKGRSRAGGGLFVDRGGGILGAKQLQRGLDLGEERLDFGALVRARIVVEAREQLLLLILELRNS
jgi:hypothetical protein